VKEAKAEGLLQLKGHSSNPGIRVSMYNAMPVEGAYHLAKFMVEFMERNTGHKKVIRKVVSQNSMLESKDSLNNKLSAMHPDKTSTNSTCPSHQE